MISLFKHASILFLMAMGTQTVGNIALHGSATQLVISFLVWPISPTQLWFIANITLWDLQCIPRKHVLNGLKFNVPSQGIPRRLHLKRSL